MSPPAELAKLERMRLLISALLFALAACSEAAAPQSRESAVAEADAPAAVAGLYHAASDPARALTGDLVIERAGLRFTNGLVLYTRTLNPRRGGDLMAKGGESYAAASLGPGSMAVELRRVLDEYKPQGRGLCGQARAQYLALTYEPRATSVTLLVFAGAEPPGPDAADSRICATLRYDAPEGARTREGVVL